MPYTVKQYRPQLKVYAWHGNTRYDLTPYVMQATTHRALGEPMGNFALLLTFKKRWDVTLTPMDYVEIYMGRFSKTPIIQMRGFISNVRRTRVMDQTGKWRRTITINGNDYGKLLKQYQIYYMANIPGQVLQGTDTDPAQGLLAPLLTENMGIFTDSITGLVPLQKFISEVIKVTLKPWIDSLRKTCNAIPQLIVSTNVKSDYALNWMSLQSLQGALDGVIDQYANAPWCEWFFIDAPDGPKLIHRDTPFKDRKGKYIYASSALNEKYWTTNWIDDSSIKEEDIGKSDAEVYDYFFTYPSLFPDGDIAYKYALIEAGELGDSSNPSFAKESDINYPTNPKVLRDFIYKYGLKILEVGSPALPIIDAVGTSISDPLSMKLSIVMNMWLVKAFEWAADMHNGTLKVMGNENLVIGKYLYSRGVQEEYYVESVDQVFAAGQPNSQGNDGVFSFESTLGVTRGRYTTTLDSGVEDTIVPPNLNTQVSLDGLPISTPLLPLGPRGRPSPTPN